MQDADSLVTSVNDVGMAMAPDRGHAAAFLRDGRLGVERPADDAALPTTKESRLPPRAGRLTGRVLRDGDRGARTQSCHVPG